MNLIFWHPATLFHNTPKDRHKFCYQTDQFDLFTYPHHYDLKLQSKEHVLWHAGLNIIQQLLTTELFVGSVVRLCLASLLGASTTAGLETATCLGEKTILSPEKESPC